MIDRSELAPMSAPDRGRKGLSAFCASAAELAARPARGLVGQIWEVCGTAAIYMRCKTYSSRIFITSLLVIIQRTKILFISHTQNVKVLGKDIRRLGSSCCTLDNGLPAPEECEGFMELSPPPPPRRGFAILPATYVAC